MSALLQYKKYIFLLFIIGTVVYFPIFFNGFVWDDFAFILNPTFGHTLNLAKLFGPNIFNATGYYRPIPALYFALLYAISSSHAFLYHLIQLILHIVNAILVFLLFRSLFNFKQTDDDTFDQEYFDSLSGSQQVKYMRKYGHPEKTSRTLHTYEPYSVVLSLFLSLIFLVHPINVESVAYIGASQSELLFIFGMSALLLSINKNIQGPKILIISGLTLLSLLTKETGFLFLLMIILFQILFYKKRVLEFLLFELITLGIYLYFRIEIGKVFLKQPFFSYPVPIDHLTLLQRVTNIPAIFLYYIQTFFFPLHLSIIQLWVITQVTLQNFYVPFFLDILFFCITCFGGVYLYRRQFHYFKLYAFFFLWFYFGIGMLLQIFPLDETVSDHWFYFPIVGLLGMFGIWIYAFLQTYKIHNESSFVINKKVKVLSTICGVILLVLLSTRTIIRNTNYHDQLTLTSHDAQIQDNMELESDVGINLMALKKYHEAYPHLQRSVNFLPYVSNLLWLGQDYDAIGNEKKAKEYYYKSINAAKTALAYDYSNNQVPLTYVDLADLLLRYHEYKEAVNVSRIEIKQYPHSGNTSTLLKVIETADNMQSNRILANPCSNTGNKDIVIGNNVLSLSMINKVLCKNQH